MGGISSSFLLDSLNPCRHMYALHEPPERPLRCDASCQSPPAVDELRLSIADKTPAPYSEARRPPPEIAMPLSSRIVEARSAGLAARRVGSLASSTFYNSQVGLGSNQSGRVVASRSCSTVRQVLPPEVGQYIVAPVVEVLALARVERLVVGER